MLAKHDERYMPREAVEALKRQGLWRGEGAPVVEIDCQLEVPGGDCENAKVFAGKNMRKEREPK